MIGKTRGALMFNGKEDFNLEAPERLCRNGDVWSVSSMPRTIPG